MSSRVHRLMCAWCGRAFAGRLQGRAAAYCSTAHRVAAHRARHKGAAAEDEDLSAAALGQAIAELRAQTLSQAAAIEDGSPVELDPAAVDPEDVPEPLEPEGSAIEDLRRRAQTDPELAAWLRAWGLEGRP